MDPYNAIINSILDKVDELKVDLFDLIFSSNLVIMNEYNNGVLKIDAFISKLQLKLNLVNCDFEINLIKEHKKREKPIKLIEEHKHIIDCIKKKGNLDLMKVYLEYFEFFKNEYIPEKLHNDFFSLIVTKFPNYVFDKAIYNVFRYNDYKNQFILFNTQKTELSQSIIENIGEKVVIEFLKNYPNPTLKKKRVSK